MAGYTKFSSNLSRVLRDIDSITSERVKKAGRYTAKVMRKNIGKTGPSTPGGFPTKRTGALRKSIGSQYDPEMQEVKAGSKSSLAHLQEYTYNRPFVMPSFREADPEIMKILSESYW